MPVTRTTGLALEFSGAHRGCTNGVSDFEVLEAVYATASTGKLAAGSGIVERFRARFTLRCSGPSSPP